MMHGQQNVKQTRGLPTVLAKVLGLQF